MNVDICRSMNGRQETRQLAFPRLRLPAQPTLSFGLPFDQLFVHHVLLRHGRKRVFILAEVPMGPGPLDIPPVVKRLHQALGPFPSSTWYAMVTGGWHEVIHIVRQMREFAADALVVAGGDVVIDLAKVVLYAHSRLVEDDEEELDMLMKPTEMEMIKGRGERLYREEQGCRPQLDFFCIPTNCGGAAFIPNAYGFNEAEETCCTLIRSVNYPEMVILDGQATLATPLNEWFTKGVEAINHAVEGILSINTNPILVALLTDALKKLCVGLLTTRSHPQSVVARSMALCGAKEAMTPLASRPQVALGASHAFCNAAQRLALIEPGLMAAVMLPPVLTWTAMRVRCQPSLLAFHKMRDQHKGLVTALWEPPVCKRFFRQMGFEQSTSNIGHMLRVLFVYLGMPSNLAALGITTRLQRENLAMQTVIDACARTAPVSMLHPNHALLIMGQVKGQDDVEDEETSPPQ